MPRARAESNRSLPKNLRCRKGYYSYMSPEGKEYGLGRDRRKAIAETIRRSLELDGPLGSMRTLTVKQILRASTLRRTACGVYFLVLGAEVVYVGQSTNVHSRLAQHVASARIPFDRYHMLPCAPSELEWIEASHIAALRPRFNRQLRLRKVASVYRRGIGDAVQQSA